MGLIRLARTCRVGRGNIPLVLCSERGIGGRSSCSMYSLTLVHAQTESSNSAGDERRERRVEENWASGVWSGSYQGYSNQSSL